MGASAARSPAPSLSRRHSRATAAQEPATTYKSGQVVKNTAGHGTFKGTLKGSTLTWTLTFSGLTGPATAAHIHMGAATVSGNVVVPLCAPCKSPVKGTAKISGSLKSAFAKHDLYVNVHTTKNPNGEIRGQLTGM